MRPRWMLLLVGMTGAAMGGEIAWVNRYGPYGSYEDRGVKVILLGGVPYVTGYVSDSVDYRLFATVKYDAATGDRVAATWREGENAQASDIAASDSGYLYVVGQRKVYTTEGFVVVKYDTALQVRWDSLYDDEEAGATAVAVRGESACVTGYKYINENRYVDYLTVKLRPGGNDLWQKTYGLISGDDDWEKEDQASAIAVDGSGNVIVTGFSTQQDSEDAVSHTDYVTIKYTPTGDTDGAGWVRRYEAGFKMDDEASDVALDDSGNVYVTGVSATPSTGSDFLTIKYSATGNTLWTRRVNRSGMSIEDACGLALGN